MLISPDLSTSMDKPDDERCPACLGMVLTPILTVTAAEAAQHFVLKEQLPQRHDELAEHIRLLWRQDHCVVRNCAACDSGFATPFVAGDATFYNLAYPRVEHPTMKWEFRRTAAELRNRDTEGKAVLEIGAGKGAFLNLVAPAFFRPADIVALEYNAVAADQLRTAGYTVASCDVRDATLDRYRGKVDFIFMFQVLEHMDRLDAMFARLGELAVRGASVFVSVPNPKRTDFQEGHRSLLDMPPNHIGRWSPRALSILGDRHSFAMETLEIEPFDVAEFLRHDLTYSYLRRAQRGGSLANRIRSLQTRRIRQAAELIFAAASVPTRAGAWLEAYTQRADLGASVWAHFRKI